MIPTKVRVDFDLSCCSKDLFPVILVSRWLQASNPSLVQLQEKPGLAGHGIALYIDDHLVTDKPLTSGAICRLLARVADAASGQGKARGSLYGGQNIEEKSLIDSWILAANLLNFSEATPFLSELNTVLAKSNKYLVGKELSLGDIFVWSRLTFCGVSSLLEYPLLEKWHQTVEQQLLECNTLAGLTPGFVSSLAEGKEKKMTKKGKSPAPAAQAAKGAEKGGSQKQQQQQPKKTPHDKGASGSKDERKEEGKYADLPGAVVGEVVVRFPPEASGFLHIGHAKAALLNQHYQLAFKGKLVFRFDDTNPEKEKEDFEKVITEDVTQSLRIKPDVYSYTSDYFDLYLEKCEKLLKEGKAYVDDTPPEQMKTEREQKIESKNRDNPVDKNFKMWQEMKNGTEYGKTCCVRAKLDMSSDNGCLRDPTLYRCKKQLHPRTGDKYNVYPTYDFACPIIDSLEGITHTLRTSEYMDRDAQYFWVLDAVQMRKPYIYAYSRLNMMHTVLSKRKLTCFVDNGLVDGWDDPRMPTVRGILRRGLTVDGLKQFIVSQGSSRAVVFMEWDKIWSINKKVIDPVVARYMAVEENNVSVNIVDPINEGETIEVNVHPKNQELGKRRVRVGKVLLVDQTDAQLMKEGETVTFINWGNVKIVKITKDDKSGLVSNIEAQLDLSNKDFKKTLKATWIEKTTASKATFVYYDHIITKPVLGKDDDFKDFVNKESKFEVDAFVEEDVNKLKKGDIVQILRKGFFICDSPHDPSTIVHTGIPTPIRLISIPDGSADLNVFPKNVQEWKQKNMNVFAAAAAAASAPVKAKSPPKSESPDSLHALIKEAGDKVRDLKANKAEKLVVQESVKALLTLKEKFKALSGTDWTPNYAPAKVEKTETIQPHVAAKAAPNTESAESLHVLIKEAGDKVRDLKAKKADKHVVTESVQNLLALKAKFKTVTGSDWTPNYVPVKVEKTEAVQPVVAANANANASPNMESADSLHALIKEAGDKVRDLKAKKAEKQVVTDSVQNLLALKGKFKAATGIDWTPDYVPPSAAAAPAHEEKKEVVPPKTVVTPESGDSLLLRIKEVGDSIRDLKAKKAEKQVIQESVNSLLELKQQFKSVTGSEWNPNLVPSVESKPAAAEKEPEDEGSALESKIKSQGERVRILKNEKKSKAEIQPEVDLLLALKKEYKVVTGKEFQSQENPGRQPKKEKSKEPTPDRKPHAKGKGKDEKKKEKETKEEPKEEDKSGLKKQTRLGIEVKKSENLAEWYTEVITKSELIEYYDVSGCYILRPWAYSIWEMIQEHMNKRIKPMGVNNCYFPMFVTGAALEKEKAHIADFAPEVAWVTKSGQTDMLEPIAIRPTSETVMYPSFAKWIRSHRDLPLQINQWCNVVRWEFKNPTPFLRTREFLWQEGHSAYADREEAVTEVYAILDLYAEVYEKLLAVPVIKGTKTEKEKFPGGDFTTTVEAFVSANGRGIQAATSHHLGQNFSKMFEIVYEDPNESGAKKYVFQNSWGLTTRSIGVMIMAHADDKGLVLPPRVASIQAIIVPCGITATTDLKDKNHLLDECKKLEKSLTEGGISCKSDLRDHYSPGWKYNHWELKGVPVRIELGPKDLQKNQLIAVRRDDGVKSTLSLADSVSQVKALLENIQESMFNKAKKEMEEHVVTCLQWKDFVDKLDEKLLILAPFCGEISCEENIKKESAKEEPAAEGPAGPLMGAKSLCIPSERQQDITAESKCIHHSCRAKPKFFTLFGRSY